MSGEIMEVAAAITRFQLEWRVSTEPVFWGYPQLLQESPYVLTDFHFSDDVLRIRCSEGAVLSVWSPRGVTMNESGLRIANAQRVRWEWQVQGAANSSPMLYFKEFWRTEQDVSGKSNAHWQVREVERRIDKGKAAVLWPACPADSSPQEFVKPVPKPLVVSAEVRPEIPTQKMKTDAPAPTAGAGDRKTFKMEVLPVFSVLLGIGLVALFIHDRNLKVYDIDLSAAVHSAPRDAGFVQLKAVRAHGFQSGYYSNNGKSTYIYAYEPLVNPGWTPREPIRYFLFSRSRATGFADFGKGRSPSMEAPSATTDLSHFSGSGLAKFPGKAVGALPVIVQRDYEAKGFTIAPDYIVIEHAHISGHEVSIWDRYDNLLIIGFATGILPLVYFMALLFRGVFKVRSLGSRTGK